MLHIKRLGGGRRFAGTRTNCSRKKFKPSHSVATQTTSRPPLLVSAATATTTFHAHPSYTPVHTVTCTSCHNIVAGAQSCVCAACTCLRNCSFVFSVWMCFVCRRVDTVRLRGGVEAKKKAPPTTHPTHQPRSFTTHHHRHSFVCLVIADWQIANMRLRR